MNALSSDGLEPTETDGFLTWTFRIQNAGLENVECPLIEVEGIDRVLLPVMMKAENVDIRISLKRLRMNDTLTYPPFSRSYAKTRPIEIGLLPLLDECRGFDLNPCTVRESKVKRVPRGADTVRNA